MAEGKARVVAAVGHLRRLAGRHVRTEPLPSRPLVLVAACVAAGCVLARVLSAMPESHGAGIVDGGWPVTSVVVGPFKGGPGSRGW